MKYTAVISDFDDTLLKDDHTVSRKTIETIKEFEKAGGFFGVCTGRMTKSALDSARSLGLTGYVMGYQGGTLCDIQTGEVLIEERISNGDAIAVVKEIQKLKRNKFQIYNGDSFIANPDNKYAQMYAKAVGVDATITRENLLDYVEKKQICPNKILVYIHPIQAKRLIRKFSKQFPTLHFVCSKKHFFEITSQRATKGKMAKKISEMLGIPREKMVCVGDSLNDISMIEYAGLGACVANARKEVKKIADHVTLSNNQDGVAQIMRDIIDGKL
ncbi:MAG: Cof-type HAD-IIB family hydrolase [Bacillota bacterium]